MISLAFVKDVFIRDRATRPRILEDTSPFDPRPDQETTSSAMASASQETVTQLLIALRDGNQQALNALFPLIYDELYAMARIRRQAWHGDYTLNTTALVHEAYLKLAGQDQPDWSSRAHFLAVASKAMRNILVDYAKHRQAQKRGGNVQKLSLDEMKAAFKNGLALPEARIDTMLSLDAALKQLERVNERQSRIVECRFFGGMSVEETAVALGISKATVKRGWSVAQAWLFRAMKPEVT